MGTQGKALALISDKKSCYAAWLMMKRGCRTRLFCFDKNALDLAKSVAEVIGCSWDYLEKTRIDGEHVEMKAKNLSVSGKKVTIVDDIIATGGTIVKATEQLKSQGASEVHAACTHGLFTKNALARLKVVCDSVISTDTIENDTSVVSVASEVAKAL